MAFTEGGGQIKLVSPQRGATNFMHIQKGGQTMTLEKGAVTFLGLIIFSKMPEAEKHFLMILRCFCHFQFSVKSGVAQNATLRGGNLLFSFD